MSSLLGGHTHDAAQSVDRSLEESDEGPRAVTVSFVVLVVTAAIQLAIVAVSGSVALLADTIHNFADALTAVPLWFAFRLRRRPPTRRYTYGYGRAEDVAGVFIVAMIAISAAVAAWEAVDRLMNPRAIEAAGVVILAGIIGTIGNELVAGYRIRVGRRIGSAALVVDGLHARTDGLTSLAVVIGALGVAAGFEQADPIVALAITAVILVVLKNAAVDIYRRLMDSVDPALVDDVERVLSRVSGVQAIESVRIRWVGHRLRVEAEIISDADLTLAEAHDISEEAHHRLLHEIPRLWSATIHTSPCGHDGRDHHAMTAHHFSAASEVGRDRPGVKDRKRSNGRATRRGAGMRSRRR